MTGNHLHGVTTYNTVMKVLLMVLVLVVVVVLLMPLHEVRFGLTN
jgi:hypothetical protein